MSHIAPEDICYITLRSIAHTSHPFINLGPTNKMYNATLQSIKSLSAETIQEINDRFKASHPDLHDDWQNFGPAQLAAYVPCIQACEDLPSSSETTIVPIVQSFKYIKLQRLDVSNFQLGKNFDHLLDSLENGDMKCLLLVNLRSTAPSDDQMTRLATHIGEMPELESLDISWNRAESGKTLPILASNLIQCKHLQILYVNNMHAPAEDMLVLAQNLPSHLTLLSIHGNEMNNLVALCLTNTLPASLTTLFISVRHLSADTHRTFMNAISHKLPRLQELRVWDSPYAGDLVQQGGYILLTCTHLDRLVLQSTSDVMVPPESLGIYVNGLRKAIQVTSLSLYGIRLDTDGFRRLVDVCRQKSLQKLQLHRNLLPEGINSVFLEDFIVLA
ncbi:uncharacterized protein [Amphiura filiformis]|uniref:uncharacterized protein n=1 Tax=Amphiura filiformis TaxID=82378 RepID=UPI003B212A8A